MQTRYIWIIIVSDTEAFVTKRNIYAYWCFYWLLCFSSNPSKKSSLAFDTADVIISLITYILAVSTTYNAARLPWKSFSLLKAPFLHAVCESNKYHEQDVLIPWLNTRGREKTII
jgi:hypothetical protein